MRLRREPWGNGQQHRRHAKLPRVKGGHGDGPPHFINNEDPKLSRKISDSTIDFMKKQVNAGNPFYVQASYYAQHLSVVCSDKALKKYESKGTPDRGYTQAWAGMLDELDQQIGAYSIRSKTLISKKTPTYFYGRQWR